MSIIKTRVNDALAGGVAFLLTRQSEDGLWHDFETLAGEASDWPTGFIGVQLLTAGVRGTAIDRAADALMRRQHRDGGWGYHRNVPSDADSTAWALTFLATLDVERSAMARAGRCLKGFQDPSTGGISTYAGPAAIRQYLRQGPRFDVRGWCTCHLEVTATAGLAFALVPDGRFAQEAEHAWRFVESRQAHDGAWDAYWWVDRHYPTLQAVALGGALERPQSISRAAAWVRSQQLGEGAWAATGFVRSAFATALCLSLLMSASNQDDPGIVRRALTELCGLQQPDGGWPGHASMRIPPPNILEPNDHRSWRVNSFGTGVMIHDHHRLFTTSACVSALARAVAGTP